MPTRRARSGRIARRQNRCPSSVTCSRIKTYLVITAPADEYFGQTKLSPIGVRNALLHISKYLDAGWGTRMTGDALQGRRCAR